MTTENKHAATPRWRQGNKNQVNRRFAKMFVGAQRQYCCRIPTPTNADAQGARRPGDRHRSEQGLRGSARSTGCASPDNPFFARSFVNRVWGHYFGVGIVHPVDDFSLGQSRRPTHEAARRPGQGLHRQQVRHPPHRTGDPAEPHLPAQLEHQRDQQARQEQLLARLRSADDGRGGRRRAQLRPGRRREVHRP